MNASSKQIAEAFSSHQFELARPYLADAIRWNLVGNKTLEGKASVDNACEESASYLATIQVVFTKVKVIVGDGCVVVDTLADYTDQQHEVTTVSSCDIYEFADGMVTAITSYSVELPG